MDYCSVFLVAESMAVELREVGKPCLGAIKIKYLECAGCWFKCVKVAWFPYDLRKKFCEIAYVCAAFNDGVAFLDKV